MPGSEVSESDAATENRYDKKHLLSYDYHAALAVGKEIKDELNPVAWKWLQSADARAVLDWERMNRVYQKIMELFQQ